ncbi:MAG: hypothetical protein L6Q84_24445 [Polyangiaceae bacterium]|nr:hypothetical protein [Polyangiaceae bacterium]
MIDAAPQSARLRVVDYEAAEREAIQGEGAPRPGSDSTLESGPAPRAEREGATIADVLRAWQTEGPLVHEPTGIARLDELTGGGPVYGSRWYLAGAPDAGKTALLVQLAHVYALRGITVGLLAVDEDAGDLVTRLAQRTGYSRHHCEARDAGVLERMGAELEGLPVRFYDGAWTIESAAHDLATFASGGRAMLGVDSVQTVQCQAELAGRELSTAEAVAERTRAIRSVATRHRLIAIATSEMSRGAYAHGEDRTATLAAGKWSGAIEYSARVLLGLRSVPGETDLVELELAKNKHGPRDERLFLRLDRRSQTLAAVGYEPPPEGVREAERDGRTRDRTTRDAGAAALVVATRPGLVRHEVEAAVRAAAGVGAQRARDALAALGEALVLVTGDRRAQRHYLDGGRLGAEVLATLSGTDRAKAESARPPRVSDSDSHDSCPIGDRTGDGDEHAKSKNAEKRTLTDCD